jgi:peroxiredoxin
MKAFLLTIAIAISIGTGAQGLFSISGNINGVKSGSAILNYQQQNQEKQLNAKIKNGHFYFGGRLPETQRITIKITGGQFTGEISLFAGNENISVRIDASDPENSVVTGSRSQVEFESYKKLTKHVDEESASLNKTGSQLFREGKMTDQAKDSLFAIRDKLDQQKKTFIADFAREHPESVVSAWAISAFYGFDPVLEELDTVYHYLSLKVQQSLYGYQVAEIIDAVKKTAIGKTATDFTANDSNGKPVSLQAYRGKYVFVDFWASWCGPCRAENPNVVNMYHQYHSDQFDILGISLDENKDAWKKAVQNDRLEWTQLCDLQGWSSNIISAYGIKGIPFNMLLDKEGRIIAKNLRGAELQKKLKDVLN